MAGVTPDVNTAVSESTVATTSAAVGSIHPAATIFPPLDPEAFEQLVADIEKHGVREPGWRDREGRILDGRHRALACTQLGVEMPWRIYQGEPGSEVALIVSLNLHRRHLTKDQRAAIAADLANLQPGDNQHSTQVPPNGGTSISQAEAAQAMQVPVRQVQRAAVVKKLDPDLHEQVKAGTLKVAEATRKIGTSKSKRGRKRKPGPKTKPHPSLPVILAALPGLDLGALRRVQAAVEKMIAQRAGGDVQK